MYNGDQGIHNLQLYYYLTRKIVDIENIYTNMNGANGNTEIFDENIFCKIVTLSFYIKK